MTLLHGSPVAGNSNPIITIIVELNDGSRKIFKGRDAWCLAELIDGGLIGVTPIERPAPRWAHYVFKLRRAGLNVETIDETHGGAYSGTHARYLLRTPLRVIEIERREGARAAA